MNLFNSWRSLFRVLIEKLEKNMPFNVISVLLHYSKISKLTYTYLPFLKFMDKLHFFKKVLLFYGKSVL